MCQSSSIQCPGMPGIAHSAHLIPPVSVEGYEAVALLPLEYLTPLRLYQVLCSGKSSSGILAAPCTNPQKDGWSPLQSRTHARSAIYLVCLCFTKGSLLHSCPSSVATDCRPLRPPNKPMLAHCI